MSLLKSMQNDQVSSLTIRPAIRCSPGETVRDAILKMREAKLGCVTVVDEDDRPLGLFTEAMLRRQLVETPEIVEQSIDAHMATAFPGVSLSDSVETVLEAMELKNTRFLMVTDDEGKVVGVTGQKGLMEYVAEYFPGEVMVQRIGGKGFTDEREGA
ncbi:MAG: CBS domain-containing protein [Planctomycetota bacterium]